MTVTSPAPRPAAVAGRRGGGLLALLAAPLVLAALAAGVLALWSASGRYPATGDEPHYLVMARGLVTLHTLEQTGPYEREFRVREVYPAAPPAGTPVVGPFAQYRVGPHGLYSPHSPGLPVLLALPLAAAGVPGARAVLVLVAAAVAALAVLAARLARDGGVGGWRAAGTAVALVAAMPFVTAAGQVYPDLAAGALFLAGCVGLLQRPGSGASAWVPCVCAALLPWLQIKNGALAVLLVAAVAVRVARAAGPRPGRRLLPLLLPAVSAAGLLLFDAYAYGRLLGPYGDGALEPGVRALETFAGLVVDQDHGLLFQDPLLLVAGVAGLVPLWRRDRLVAAVVALGALVVLALNALHPNWYGGGSFAGRFMWTSAVALVLPAALLLQQLWRARPAATRLLLAGATVLQLALVAAAVLRPASAPDLYNKAAGTPLADYSTHLGALARWLPALYEDRPEPHLAPNLLWVLATVAGLAVAARRAARLVPST